VSNAGSCICCGPSLPACKAQPAQSDCQPACWVIIWGHCIREFPATSGPACARRRVSSWPLGPSTQRLRLRPDPTLCSHITCSSWGQAERVQSFLRQPARPRKVRKSWPAWAARTQQGACGCRQKGCTARAGPHTRKFWDAVGSCDWYGLCAQCVSFALLCLRRACRPSRLWAPPSLSRCAAAPAVLCCAWRFAGHAGETLPSTCAAVSWLHGHGCLRLAALALCGLGRWAAVGRGCCESCRLKNLRFPNTIFFVQLDLDDAIIDEFFSQGGA